MEYALAGVAAWIGASVLAALGWARFHTDVRARETRARSIRPTKDTLPTFAEERGDEVGPARRTA